MRLWQHLLKQQVVAQSGYRYWRIFIQNNNGSTYLAIDEIELRSSIGGIDLTNPATPISASVNSALAHYAISNQLDLVWLSNQFETTNQWLRIDLNIPTSVKQIAIHPQSGDLASSPRNFIIQGSNDGTNFTDVKAFTDVTGWTNAWKTFDL